MGHFLKLGLCACLVAVVSTLAACAPVKPAAPFAQTASTTPTLPPSNAELADAGTVFVWRDLNSGEELDETVGTHSGRLSESRFRGKRSFWYMPDPWADNENTNAAAIEPLFPLAVGKTVAFDRRPRIGLTKDTVTVVRAETLVLPFGPVDTYVITTESRAVMSDWVGRSTMWYAPALRWIVQQEITDNKGDNRRRQVIEVRQP